MNYFTEKEENCPHGKPWKNQHAYDMQVCHCEEATLHPAQDPMTQLMNGLNKAGKNAHKMVEILAVKSQSEGAEWTTIVSRIYTLRRDVLELERKQRERT